MVSNMPRPYFTPGKDPVPNVQEAGWAPWPVWTGGKSRPTGIRTPDRPARSQSLYRLSYPAHPFIINLPIYFFTLFYMYFYVFITCSLLSDPVCVCVFTHIISVYSVHQILSISFYKTCTNIAKITNYTVSLLVRFPRNLIL